MSRNTVVALPVAASKDVTHFSLTLAGQAVVRAAYEAGTVAGLLVGAARVLGCVGRGHDPFLCSDVVYCRRCLRTVS